MSVMSQARAGWTLLKRSAVEFIDDDCMSSAAAIAYYCIFSVPAILAIVLMIATSAGKEDDIVNYLAQQMAPATSGENGGENPYHEEIESMTAKARQLGSSLWMKVVGIAVLIFSATGVLAQLQYSLNRAWEVQPDPAAGGIKNFLLKRALSFGMILAFAFLLLASTFLSMALTSVGGTLAGTLGIPVNITFLVSIVVNLVVITLLFAAIFRILPDAKIGWKSVGVGSLFTAILFMVGKYLIGLYISMGGIQSTYGTLVAVLVWFYYSSLIVLFGAEFAQVWARRYGTQIVPTEGAVRVVQEKKTLRTPQEQRDHDLHNATLT